MCHKHSPLPWRLRAHADYDKTYGEIESTKDSELSEPIAIIPCDDVTTGGLREVKANAAYIVEACNSYDRMRAALEHIRDNFDHEHHSKGQVAKGECDGAPQCRACEAAEALGGQMSAQHTPGKWWTETGCEVWADTALIATVHRAQVGRTEGDANARLLASAPELLEACKAAKALLPKLEVHNYPPGFREKDDALLLLSAAIAKAEHIAR
jgi:hypothetical protein